jgi:hypothetical protein
MGYAAVVRPDSTTIRQLTVDRSGTVFFMIFGWRNGRPMNLNGTFAAPLAPETDPTETEPAKAALKALLHSVADGL